MNFEFTGTFSRVQLHESILDPRLQADLGSELRLRLVALVAGSTDQSEVVESVELLENICPSPLDCIFASFGGGFKRPLLCHLWQRDAVSNVAQQHEGIHLRTPRAGAVLRSARCVDGHEAATQSIGKR